MFRTLIRNLTLSTLLLLLPVSQLGCAELQAMGIDVEQLLAATAPLDVNTVTTGLKQALEVGTHRTTATLSQEGAFGNDPILRLKLPGEMGRLAEVLRCVGFGAQVDLL